MWYLSVLLFMAVVWYSGYSMGCLVMRARTKREIDDLRQRPAFSNNPKTAYQQIIQQIEKQGAWIIRFRWGEDTAVLLCSQPRESLHTREHRSGPPFRRYTFATVVGPKRWLDAATQAFSEVPHNRRDIYIRRQHGGRVIVVQRPYLANVGANAMLEDEMMCWHGVAFDTYAETVTLDQDPQVIV